METFKKTFLLLIISTTIQAQTFRLFIAADVADAEFGMTSIGDGALIEEMCNKVAKSLGYGIKKEFLEKNTFNSKSIRKVLRETLTSEGDIMFFYYSGKGFYPESSLSKFPFLQLNDSENSPLSLDEIASIINTKKEAFGFVLADCREERAGGLETEWPLEPEESFDKLVSQKLFLSNCGVVKIATSQKGQKALTTPSGQHSAFTKIFTQDYKDHISTNSRENLEMESIEALLRSTESWRRVFIPGAVGQNFEIEITPCSDSRKDLLPNFPSLENMMTLSEFNRTLRNLLFIKPASERSNIIKEISLALDENAAITLKKFVPNSSQPTISHLKTKEYLTLLKDWNSNLVEVDLNTENFLRTTDFTKIKKIEIQEMWTSNSEP